MTPQRLLQSGEPASARTTRPPGATEVIYRRLFGAGESPGKLSAHIPRGGETILMVEDTNWLLELIRRNLQTCGYTVLAAAHGEEAIQLAGTAPGNGPPARGGSGVAGNWRTPFGRRIGALKPGIKLLYISGYTADAVLRHGLLESETAFLQKPFPSDALACKVREVLDR